MCIAHTRIVVYRTLNKIKAFLDKYRCDSSARLYIWKHRHNLFQKYDVAFYFRRLRRQPDAATVCANAQLNGWYLTKMVQISLLLWSTKRPPSDFFISLLVFPRRNTMCTIHYLGISICIKRCERIGEDTFTFFLLCWILVFHELNKHHMLGIWLIRLSLLGCWRRCQFLSARCFGCSKSRRHPTTTTTIQQTWMLVIYQVVNFVEEPTTRSIPQSNSHLRER